MKYARTEDGHILEIGKTTDYGYVVMPECKKAVHFLEKEIEIIPVIKQADTIEKLVDGFIIGETLKIYNKSNFDFEKKMVNLGQKYWVKLESLKSVYGVVMVFDNDIPRIRTVAKMNEKGELELL